MLSKKGGLLVQVLVVLIVIILTSGLILYLVSSGVLTPDPARAEVDILNAEFIPLERTGTLTIKEFDMCEFVDEELNCFHKTSEFQRGTNIYLRALVESTVFGGQLSVGRNYRVVDSQGKVILELEDTNQRDFDYDLEGTKENLAFSDTLFFEDEVPAGDYELQLIVENQLTMKQATLTRGFRLI
ncbi:hypothetical protein COV20_02280 [Candidatus Woesearchaeota archaeon CG10_big_fil_rev_8_21_14_0_10_45_16]|nr:MAG: hypothetical protein COV20_02280 [Candidatus Woesearchaeota archaeon CG10_big_fil_rev_8_21_14_0_10_45_16]